MVAEVFRDDQTLGSCARTRSAREEYAAHFDNLFGARAQREGFRRYLEGLLLPAERNKTLTALANTEPVVGAQNSRARRELAVVPFGVPVGPADRQRAQAKAPARRAEDGPDRFRSTGHRRD